jgi:hypothetical protein
MRFHFSTMNIFSNPELMSMTKTLQQVILMLINSTTHYKIVETSLKFLKIQVCPIKMIVLQPMHVIKTTNNPPHVNSCKLFLKSSKLYL